ncbi:ent-copalyl diphosphate synthase 1-like [Vicia villosa]|uniref:ent-copalyl diphosphate synthase 1-like n=1 Tax=Vicia villosa TaxID=3911 RepID=UPI00273AC391|nr:ent-copalyl diphosphate synthase 1-like [Vicia villosa]
MASQISVCASAMLPFYAVKLPAAKSNYPSNLSLQSSFHSLKGTRPVGAIKAQHDKNSESGFQPMHSQASQDSVLSDEAVKNDGFAESFHQVMVTNKIRAQINEVKRMLRSMEDGEISISAYDTAWVALVKSADDENKPQFPTSLQWIVDNQLADGSWGDELFVAHDRILNTLACVIALKSWNVHPDMCDKGMEFFVDNLDKIQDENAEHMPIGFEVAFPSLLNIAKSLNIEVPEDSPILKEIFSMRDQKLKKIPRDVLHKVPTTLLHSLEGMQDLDWNQLLQLQSQDGSFLFSPSSTAFAIMQTGDKNALNYLQKIVEKFNGGVPNVFPVDLFEHIWAVDRLECLGVSRYFKQEIKDSMNYLSRYWTEKGICWARNSEVQDIDDTAMGFRLLRLHGHQVSPDVFKNFEKDGEFFCFAGQVNQAVTGMFNLYRASQVMFKDEEILENARSFSGSYLTKKRFAKQLFDKWIITKDLPREVGYALDVPWYASLPRVEARLYLEHYGGKNDVWIGKTLYRMPYVNNDVYLELAKLDYNKCQEVHKKEWEEIQRWYLECELEGFGVDKDRLQYAYFVAAASIFEPERSLERLAWAKTKILIRIMKAKCKVIETTDEFGNQINEINNLNKWLKDRLDEKLMGVWQTTLDLIGFQMFKRHDQENSHYLTRMWQSWFASRQSKGLRSPGDAELIVQTIILTSGNWSEDLELDPRYQKLLDVTRRVCLSIYNFEYNWVQVGSDCKEVEAGMQELVQLVVQSSPNDLPSSIKNTFLMVAKSFYYTAYCDHGTISYHIYKVLFQKVI